MHHKISTGIRGLDEILLGGFIPNRSYLLQGGPGSGKSTIAYHFLQQAASNGDKALFITLGEPAENVKENAKQVGIDLSEVEFLDLTPSANLSEAAKSYNVFTSTEVEQQPIIEAITDAVEKHSPKRVVFDSITMLRFLNRDAFQYRNLGLSLVKYIAQQEATMLIISESAEHVSDQDSVFWVDGVINVQYSPGWRKLEVSKYRGSDFMQGTHAFKISGEGLEIYPRLQPNKYERHFEEEVLSSGIDEIDNLLYGGLEKGTTTLITGASGVGKTNLGIQFMKEAASRNERSAIYTFEESKELIRRRSNAINIPVDEMIREGNLKIVPVEPLSYSPDEFASMVRKDVEQNDTRMVMIDTMGGYGLAVRQEDTLERLHSLSVYLQNMGATTLLINESQDITGNLSTTSINASYLADNIIFLRYLEINGEMKKAIGVLKKRLSDFEKSIREFVITSEGIKVGQPLTNLRGILSGVPEFIK
ncbi:hypothetical protein NC796_00655 [Aliifodinibius sp. S!AR15-10]|uniref:ATPase domain-containing protein n=1 Tax=Aliifodinibius sp. S!AR15-10 TaxID=2950437 RepID=UPI0028600715|nr:ATPase domain-containing protein [Aliifodinibius sp. S!AR15-10]MDR8389624.1 hypothetical protein [Aliifodinibius sp. S!AR15-10]